MHLNRHVFARVNVDEESQVIILKPDVEDHQRNLTAIHLAQFMADKTTAAPLLLHILQNHALDKIMLEGQFFCQHHAESRAIGELKFKF